MSEVEFEGAETPEVEAPEAPPEAPEEPWSLDQSEWERTQQFIQAAGPMLGHIAELIQTGQLGGQQQAPPQAMPEAAPPPVETFDPFEPESVQQYIQSQIHQGMQEQIAQTMGPYESLLGMVASREGEMLARQEFERIQQEVGAFDEDAAFTIANGLIETGHDPSQALRQAAGFAKDWEARIRADEREAYQKELGNIAQAPGEAVGGAVGETQQPVPTGRGRYEAAIRMALERRTPVNPIG